MNELGPGECEAYYETYTSLVAGRDVLEVITEAPDALQQLLTSVAPAQEVFAYAPGKWSIREVVGHVIDTERLFGYRALHICRADPAPLPGMEQDDWAAASNAATRSLEDLLEEFRALRAANTRFFASLDETALSRHGQASGFEFTVRAIVHIITGHEIHHRNILRERYLPGLD